MFTVPTSRRFLPAMLGLLAVIVSISLVASSRAVASPASPSATVLRSNPLDGAIRGERPPASAWQLAQIRQAALPGPAAPSGTWVGLQKQFEETTDYIKDTDFLDANTGWAVGEPHWDQIARAYVGTILHTVDGGATWITQTVPVAETLRGVKFLDPNQGWAAGANGTIVHTLDGGSHWTPQSVATADEFRGLAFIDADHGWVTSLHPTHYDWQGEADNWRASLWVTANGGQTWITQTLPTGSSILNRIDFVDAQNGWTVGAKDIGNDQYGYPQHRGVIYHTLNGGQTWVEVTFNPEELEVSLTAVDFVDADHGWVAGFPTRSDLTGGFVFHTANGGATWDRQQPGDFYAPLWDIQFIDQNKGYAVGFDYVGAWGPPVWRTQDGGATWDSVRMDRHDNEGLFGVAVTGSQVIALGDHDYQAKSTRAWDTCPTTYPDLCYDCTCLFEQSYKNTHFQLLDVFFSDANHGWAVGNRSYIPEITGQEILATQDGGETWHSQFEQAPDLTALFSYFRLDGVCFADNAHGWAVGSSEMLGGTSTGYHNAILHTQDGGQTWQEQGRELYSSWSLEFTDIKCLDSQNAWALAGDNFPSSNIFLAHTADGGAHWSWSDTGIEGNIMIGFGVVVGGVDFTDPLHGWAVGGLGQVVHTENGGTTWISQTVPSSSSNLFAIDMIDAQNGWIAGESLSSTANGGMNWSARETGQANGWLHDVQFVDASHGWMAGDGGAVLYTTDGGNTWRLANNPQSAATLNGLSFINPQKGWMVGDYGTILTTVQHPLLYLPLVRR